MLDQLLATSPLEGAAVVLAVAYLWLAMRQSQWCWPAALVSTLIYVVLFYDVALLSESVLNLYYMAMAGYGWWSWRQGTQGGRLPVNARPLGWHLRLIAVGGLLSLGWGYLMANHTQAAFPYLDGATSCFAVLTTWMVTRKVLENWLYWVVIDGVSIWLYLQKDLAMTALLFLGYVLMALSGYWSWRRDLQPA
ncbi:nicotinamide riboside transporter PnuC [Gallaecimonas kandeliae]|nr:nicotinamide riboside transporter PnuC [Gallaecimonas kandeliae]WKE67463.1 nicotinamide riboside transporter PnuC [Gallaecimonas kandeliae]